MRDPLRQGIALLGLAVLCAGVAATIHPGDETGLLALGVGLIVASVASRWRLLLAGFVVTPFALVNVAWAGGILPSSYLAGAYVLAAAVAMGATNLAARRALVGAHPVSPIAVLALIGGLLIGISVPHNLFGDFFRWFVSWWMPAVMLGALSLVRLSSLWQQQAQSKHTEISR